jgi:hypothetical protein
MKTDCPAPLGHFSKFSPALLSVVALAMPAKAADRAQPVNAFGIVEVYAIE